MCLIFVAHQSHLRYRLIVAANRDEDYTRPTSAAAFWEDQPQLLAGRDLTAMGTWLGITRDGRFAAVTNYRSPRDYLVGAPSRGSLVTDYLLSATRPSAHLATLSQSSHGYNGFNVLFADPVEFCWYSNQDHQAVVLDPNIYGLSNGILDSPWPKVAAGKAAVAQAINSDVPSVDELFDILADETLPDSSTLPDTGVGAKVERQLSPAYIRTEQYGTRSSTVVMVDVNGHVTFFERTHTPTEKNVSQVAYEFDITVNDKSVVTIAG